MNGQQSWKYNILVADDNKITVVTVKNGMRFMVPTTKK